MVTAPHKARVGVRLRRFREERGLTQAAMATALGISPSYVNQLESNQRPITASVLLKLASVFDVDLAQFSTEEADRLVAQLRDVFADASLGEQVSMAEMREVAATMPSVARSIVELHRRHRHSADASVAATVSVTARSSGDDAQLSAPLAYEQVRDLFYAHRNYFDDIDRAAEELARDLSAVGRDRASAIEAVLAARHGIRAVEEAVALDGGRRAFRLAARLAEVEIGDLIERHVAEAELVSDDARALARVGLANYFAGALVLPYGEFLTAAEGVRYDIELLQRRFGVGYETVAHRLSALQRPGAIGVPFFFVRVDRAGNISKRQSATDFHFSQVGGSCPLWNVYEAFARPGQICLQLAQMPDGRSSLWVARTVTEQVGGHGTPMRMFAIGIGCDLHHAHRLVYGDGLDLANPSARTPIGPGCQVCDRPACPQRAFPTVTRSAPERVMEG